MAKLTLKLMDENNYIGALNRDYTSKSSRAHIEKLKASILEWGQLRDLVVDKDGFIFAGQHRFVAMRELISEGKFSKNFTGEMKYKITDMSYREYQLAENLEKKHNKEDSIKTMASGDMITFMNKYADYVKRNGNFAIYAMAQYREGNGGQPAKIIKNGEYKVPDWDRGFVLMQRLDDINAIFKAATGKRVSANEYNQLFALISHKEYEHMVFIDKLKKFIEVENNRFEWKTLPRQVEPKQFFFNKIYNYKSKNYVKMI